MKKIIELKNFLLVLGLFVGTLYAIKTDVFNYKIYSTDNFDIYYIKDEFLTIMPLVEQILDEVFVENTEFFDVTFDYKIPFFIFYGYQQFLQNTIVPVDEGTGGVTEAFKNRFLVPYTGSMKFLQHVITHEFVHEIEFNILYSGFWRTPLLLKSIFYPNWLLEGLAEYQSRLYIKTQQEMYVRDMAVSNKLIPLEHLHNFSHLKPHMILPAYEESAKLMEFIATEYGTERLKSMLRIYRGKFDVNSVLYPTLGINLKELQRKFFEELTVRYNYEVKVNSMTDLPLNKKLTKDGIYPVHNNFPVRFRNQLIFLSDKIGKPMFYYLDENKKTKILIPKRVLENTVDIIQRDNTRISISLDGKLCFVGLKNNRAYIFLYNVLTKKIDRIPTKDVVDILTCSFISSDGSTIYLSGIKNCRSVVYSYDISSGKFSLIKEDENYISQIAASKDGKKLIYVKEQLCKKQNKPTWQNDIFVFDLEKRSEEQITNTLSDEEYPYFVDDKHIFFISDFSNDYTEKFYGVKNVYMVDLDNKMKWIQLTNVIGGITYLYANQDKVYLTYYREFNQHIYEFTINELLQEQVSVLTHLLDLQNKEDVKPENLIHQEKFGIEYKTRPPKPYKFYFSTDLFIPLIYFSSYEGLLMLLYWQGSDMLGEHNLGVSSIVLGDKNYNIGIQYVLTRYRPTIFCTVAAQSSYNQFTEKISRLDRLLNFGVGISYPVDRLSYLTLLLNYINQTEEFKNEDETIIAEAQENIVAFGYTRNTLTGKFLEPTKGAFTTVTTQISDRFIDGDYSYVILRLFRVDYFDLGNEFALFTRLQLLSSSGRDRVSFYLGGPDRISGLWYDEVVSAQALMLTGGLRMPLVYDINYYMWYLFPDLFFKSLFSEVFIDAGINETHNVYSSLGVRFKLYSFILQRFVLRFELIFARQFDINKPIYVYFNLTGGI